MKTKMDRIYLGDPVRLEQRNKSAKYTDEELIHILETIKVSKVEHEALCEAADRIKANWIKSPFSNNYYRP